MRLSSLNLDSVSFTEGFTAQPPFFEIAKRDLYGCAFRPSANGYSGSEVIFITVTTFEHWDMLFLFESKFYQFRPQEYKLWTTYLVKITGSLLKQLVNNRPLDSRLYDIGTHYFTILDPTFQLFGKILPSSASGKIASIYLHHVSASAYAQDLRQLILKIWEFLDHDNFQCDLMVLYVTNTIENHDFIANLLRNLSWLNGSLMKPIGSITPDAAFGTLRWTDDKYVILQFQV
ncbi:unnamed protein product [Kluyveromyces dobzhanskii CBS 2104]|uniref:WGS project CCBQ000000000 data, contig 00009 n=1 Tax=Kluyveromyces dobzhanskii CBS 2104 TaxID=1427455 RepID=A0A0A8L4Y3_9SACH|nr:unnamed protein product [Kluyveromyces dobzhanskii CBS 2104]